MRNTLLAFAVVLSSGCVVIDAAVDRDTEHINQTAALAPGGTLKLKNFSGRVTITGTDRQDASIDAVRRGTRERLNHIKLDIHQEGSTLVVNANQRDHSWSRHSNNVVETDFHHPGAAADQPGRRLSSVPRCSSKAWRARTRCTDFRRESGSTT